MTPVRLKMGYMIGHAQINKMLKLLYVKLSWYKANDYINQTMDEGTQTEVLSLLRKVKFYFQFELRRGQAL